MFLLTLITFFDINSTFNTTGLTILPKKQTLSLLAPQWYFIHINSYKDISKIKSILPNLKISPLEFNGDHLTLYLTPSEVRLINRLGNIKIYTKTPKKTTFSSSSQNNETYIVYAHSSFVAPHYSKTISHLGPYYMISTNQPIMIENDPAVLSIKKVPSFKLMNRWTTGFLQSGDQNYIIKNGFYTSNRKYNERGLNGSNVIVTLIDTGTEVNNCLFNDPNYPTPYNETNLNHRKIIRYDPFVDRYDKVMGHGTHCAGIIAGSVDSLPMSLYNGQAPAAKLYVADIGSDKTKSIDVSYTFDIFKQAVKLDSPIISCSWGSVETDPEFTQMFDYLSYEHPSQLFVFAAGNDFYKYTVGSPANSKNVLTIASSYPPRSYYLDEKKVHIVKIIDDNEKLNVASNNIFNAMKKYDISYFNNIELITYNENLQGSDYSNKAVIYNVMGTNLLQLNKTFDLLASYNAKAVIIFDKIVETDADIIVLTVTSLQKSFFDKHHKINISVELPEKTTDVTAAYYSSKGPSIYGNRKPDIMAPGTYIASASNKENSNECTAKASIVGMSGTSMATPAVSGSLALVYQYLIECIHGLPNDLSKKITSALLRAFAVAGSGDKATIVEGFGNLNLSRILIYPDLDPGRGLRFCSNKIKNDESFSYFIKTDHVGPLSVTLAWIDVPINLRSLYPLFSYFEFYIIGPDGTVYDTEEQFSTNKKIVINNAQVGTYEIRLKMSQIVPSDLKVDYSLVVVGPFEQLNFINNPSELKPSSPTSCSPKCSSKCESATCVCDKLHTGSNCEFNIVEIAENTEITHSMQDREFFYTLLDLSKYKNMKESDWKYYVVSIEVVDKGTNYGNGIIRYFFNSDNKWPVLSSTNFIQYKARLTTTMSIPLSDLLQYGDSYIAIFNDYGINISFSFKWSVKLSAYPKIDDPNYLVNDEYKEGKESKTHNILMLSLIIIGSVAVITFLVLLAVKIVKDKRKKRSANIVNNYQQYTDAGPNQVHVTLVDDV